MRIFEAPRLVSSLVAPPRCASCSASCDWRMALCSACDGRLAAATPILEPGPPWIDAVVAAGPFDGAVRDVALALKFSRRLPLARRSAEAIAIAAPPGLLTGTIVPVPAAPLRWRARGFDPAEEIALALASVAGLDYRPCLARRGGPRQVGRPRRLRIAGPPRVHLAAVAPRQAILVDDVRTTGATLSACARALREGGCRRVVAATLARAR